MVKKTRKRVFLGAVFFLGLLFTIILCALIHTWIFPFALESALRQYIISHFIILPVVADYWGPLLTRVQPLDPDHLAVGRPDGLMILRREVQGFSKCAEIKDIGVVHDFVLRNNILYAAKGAENLAWYDVGAPCQPRQLGKYLFGGYGFGIKIISDRLYLANRAGGLVVFKLDRGGKPEFESMRYGTTRLLNDQSSPWVTNDLDLIDDWLAAADGNQGVLMFQPEGKTGAGIRAFFTAELAEPEKGRNIDPAPLRIKIRAPYIYLAMRKRGVAVLEHAGAGELKLKQWNRIDGEEVVDLALSGASLYVPSAGGFVYAYDLSTNPELTSPPIAKYALGGKKIIHSLAVQPPYLYVSTVGAGLYVYNTADTKLAATWRPPDEYRSIAKVGERFVAALGSGGFGVFEGDADQWRMIYRRSMPSYVYGVTGLGDRYFAVSADLGGTTVFQLDPQGPPRELLHIPTPEHAFSAAFLPPDQLATANGVYGLLRYQLRLNGKAPTYTPLGEPSPGGYMMHVDAWKTGFVGPDFAGPLRVFNLPALQARSPRLVNCFTGAGSADAGRYAMACSGDKVRVFSAESSEMLSFTHRRDVVSLLPAPPYLLVGGFPQGVSVYLQEAQRFRLQQELDTTGTPYNIMQDAGRFWIAAGKGGVDLLEAENGAWRLQHIPIDDRSAARGENTDAPE